MKQGIDSYGYTWEVKKHMGGGKSVVMEVFDDALILSPKQAREIASALNKTAKDVEEVERRKKAIQDNSDTSQSVTNPQED